MEDLLLRTDMKPPFVTSPSTVKVTQNSDGSLTVTGLKASGDSVMIYSGSGAKPDFSIKPVAPQSQYLHYWGYHSKPSPLEAVSHFPKDLTVTSVSFEWLGAFRHC